jgi:hypothetical protein
VNYRQHIAAAMLKMGDGDRAAALLEFGAALDEAGRVDPEGPRVAEVLSTMSVFHAQAGEETQAAACRARAEKIFSRFKEAGEE